MKFPWSFRNFKGVTKRFRCGSLRGVLKAFQGAFKKLLRVFQECFLGCLKQPPKECAKEVIEVYGNYEGVSKNFKSYKVHHHNEWPVGYKAKNIGIHKISDVHLFGMYFV